MKVRVVNSETDLPSSSRSPSRGTDWTSTIATLPPAWASDVVLPRRAKSHDEESERKHLLGESPTTSAARMSLDEGRTRMMSASEKRLNVRRAQKMTKKFGQAPPHTLFQITTNHENASSTRISINIDLDLTSPTTSLRRHSTTTTYTISVPRSPAASSTWSFHAPEDESNNADAQATTPTAARRRSSMGSFMGLGDGSGSATSLSRVKTIPSPILVEFPAAAKEGAGQVVSPTTSAPVVTPTTPKASNSVARRKRTLSGSKSQSAFATKRRQATKLTKFFGVEYPDLYQAMVTTTTTTTTTTTFTDAEEKSKSGSISGSVPEKKPHYQKASATRIRKSSDTAPPTAYKHKKRKSVVAAALSSTGSASDSASLRVGVDDSCRWSAKGPEEVEELMAKLRSMKA
ncbi:hypothetical protein FRB90_008384 [Tulasnella sp. 427]|nr:hypothetical protein FRB90_008384 [Tulasnella sp. 427]